MRTVTLVLAAAAVVYCGTPITLLAGQPAQPSPTTLVGSNASLPRNVQEMRDMILAAVHSGTIDDLAPAIEHNPMPPTFGAQDAGGTLAQLKSLSADGSGRDLLAVMANILDQEPAQLPIGRDAENNIVYVWPSVSERPLDQLTPAEHVLVLRLMSPIEAKAMIDNKEWSWWRLAIGADGRWLTFMKASLSKPAASK
jgi:hypothetical protein